MTTIGFIGSGNIGSQVARQAVRHGYRVVVSNSRGPETLSELVAELGPTATAATALEAAQAGDIVVVSTPLKSIWSIPVEPLAGKVVIDTNNYYPSRDGQIAALDDDSTTSSELLQAHLVGSHVVKAFNHIAAAAIIDDARPAGAPDRRGLVIAGDNEPAKATVSAFIDLIGFDAVDAGSLADSWRIQPGTPGYGPIHNAKELRDDLAASRRTGPLPS
ncbi:MAG: oxidoreductase [Acidimicrobiia bacterium]|nr:oxidoreductase [Acidimicrobiia bacterium]